MGNSETKIITATIDWIKRDDYQQLSMRKLAAKIGMTTGVLYKHFKNKDELFYCVAKVISAQVAQDLQINPNTDAKQELLQLAKKLCQLSAEQPKLVDFLFFNPSLDEFYRQPNQDFLFYNQVLELVSHVNHGSLSNQQFLTQIWAFIMGYLSFVIKQIVSYDERLVELTLSEMIAGA